MSSKDRNVRRRWLKVGLLTLLVLAFFSSLAGCERPKSSGLPTIAAPVATTTISQVTVSASPTIVTTFDTLTPQATSSPTTPLPTNTPTLLPAPTSTVSTPGTVTYTVVPGDTLYSIARRYNVTVNELMALNGITDPSSLRVGQVLIISRGTGGITPLPPGQETIHVVQRGENLFRIALRYGTTVQAIANKNGIVNPALIWVGQKLIIPVGGGTVPPPTQIHTVQPGENLYRIALRYGTTPWAIAIANGLNNINYIYVGQRLRIP